MEDNGDNVENDGSFQVQRLDNNENSMDNSVVVLDDDSQPDDGGQLRDLPLPHSRSNAVDDQSNENVPDSQVTPTRRKRKRTSPVKQPTPKKSHDSFEDDDDGATCPICFDSWEMTGEHRIVSLKCGHLFGESCIRRWIRECLPSMKTCPSCKSKAIPRDIRHIYAKRIIAVDKTEEYRLQTVIDNEKEKSIKLQENISTLQYELAAVKERAERLAEKLQAAQLNGTIIDGAGVKNFNPRMYKLSLEKSIDVYREPGCRAMAYGRRSQSLFVSQKSSQNLFPGYGVRSMNVEGLFLSNSFLHMSAKQIRDLSLDNDEELIVSASMDPTVKLFSIPNKCPITTFTPSDKCIWSVAFDRSRSKYLYLGSQHGSTYVYDIRSPHTFVKEYNTLGDMSPVVSICPIPHTEQLPFGGFIVCKLQSIWFYEYTGSQEIISTKLIVDGPFVSVTYDELTQHLLISTRPSQKYTTTRHIIATLTKMDQNVILRCVTTINGSKTQKVMCRSTQMKVLDDIVVAAYLEDNKQLTTWNAQKETKMQSLPIADTIFDTCPLYINHKVYLSALSETRLRLYQVNTQN